MIRSCDDHCRAHPTAPICESSIRISNLKSGSLRIPRESRLSRAGITYVPTWAGFLYLAVVLDACSRRIVGWSMATTLAARLVLDALNMAIATRRPSGVIHHL